MLKFTNQSKYKDFIEKLFKESNQKFIDINIEDKIFCEKYREINEYVVELKSIKKITIKDFIKIKEYAISKGGFLTSDKRKVLYKKIYLLNHSITYKMFYNDYKAVIDRNWDFHKLIFLWKKLYDEISNKCNDKIIMANYCRSKILQGAKDENDREKEILITQDLCKFLKLMCRLNNNIYNYYQGYHDLALFFILLYHKCSHYDLSVFQSFSELNLKELLNIKYKQKKLLMEDIIWLKWMILWKY